MRVLLLAQSCNPEQSSEPSFHYHVAREIAERWMSWWRQAFGKSESSL